MTELVETYELNNDVTLRAAFSGSPALSDVRLYVRSPASADPVTYAGAEISDDGGGAFSKILLADTPGAWFWTFAVQGGAHSAVDGAFIVDPSQARQHGAADANDLRTLIPRVRRAMEGIGANSPLTSALTDDQVLAAIADSVAEVILYCGSAFGKQLQVVSRDAFYLAPNEWRTDTPLGPDEETVIASQATLNHFFFHFVNLKTHEAISDEAQSWEYDLSPTLLRDQMKYLVDQRDKALATISEDLTTDAYESFLHVRDIQTSQFIEPYIQVGGIDQVLTGQDVRFGDW